MNGNRFFPGAGAAEKLQAALDLVLTYFKGDLAEKEIDVHIAPAGNVTGG